MYAALTHCTTRLEKRFLKGAPHDFVIRALSAACPRDAPGNLLGLDGECKRSNSFDPFAFSGVQGRDARALCCILRAAKEYCDEYCILIAGFY